MEITILVLLLCKVFIFIINITLISGIRECDSDKQFPKKPLHLFLPLLTPILTHPSSVTLENKIYPHFTSKGFVIFWKIDFSSPSYPPLFSYIKKQDIPPPYFQRFCDFFVELIVRIASTDCCKVLKVCKQKKKKTWL